MATDKTTSQESSGGSFEYGDLIRIARSGSNYKLPADTMFAESLQLNALITKKNTSTLVVGKWYYVTDFTGMINATTTPVYVQALAIDQTDDICYYPVQVLSVNQVWRVKVHSNFANVRYVETHTGSRFYPATNTITSTFVNNSWRFNDSIFERWTNSGNVPQFNITQNQLIVNQSRVAGTTITNTSNSLMNIENCQIEGGSISNTSNRQIYMQGCKFTNCTITFSTTAPTSSISLNNCNWRNVNVTIHGNPSGTVTVFFLNVSASASSLTTPNFTIDGQWQSQVVNLWGGDAILDDYQGFSTVKMNLPFVSVPNGTQPCWNAQRVYCATNSIVGEYLLNENTAVNNTTYSIQGISNLTSTLHHSVIVRPKSNFQNNIYNFTLRSSAAAVTASSYEIISYHGVGAKAGELKLPNSTVRVQYTSAGPSQSSNAYLHLLPTGAHYD